MLFFSVLFIQVQVTIMDKAFQLVPAEKLIGGLTP